MKSTYTAMYKAWKYIHILYNIAKTCLVIPKNCTATVSAYTFAIEIFRISLKFLFALVNAVERGQANVTSYFSPLRYLIDIPCSTGHLSGLHS